TINEFLSLNLNLSFPGSDKNGMRPLAAIALLFLSFTGLQAQAVRLEGVVMSNGGEVLPFANLLVTPDSMVVPADASGRFAAKVLHGNKDVIVSYAGQVVERFALSLHRDTVVVLNVDEPLKALDEVAIQANRYSSEGLVQSMRTGTTVLTGSDLEAVPSIGGEA